ncbi:methyl-coenzyme M reductase operon protein D [uncultured Methanobrevibacter sp.]|uniref:methyl-coenzyme M reductase operon protein D n=1 Tax=uncultured Methanobrevibacter sp. TaxID=253161 RepID=UPI0025F70ED9|nr:methyl-coenzyme M reductase operon protein D [uncultured Methanobrevibacter sp.]
MDESEKVNVIDIKIIPNRYLKPDTTEKLLNSIYNLEGHQRVLIHGPSIPLKVFYGPGKGHVVNHTDRKVINVKGNDLELRVMVGEIVITVDISKFNEFMEDLEGILDEFIPCDYSMLVGIFTRTKSTISDYLKYGNNFESAIDERYIGLVDSRAKTSETVKVIK